MATTTGQVITRPVQELLGQHAGYGFAGYGVSTAIGNFTQTVLDLSFPAGLLGLLDWTRTYNSRSQAAGVLGQGWATSFTVSLQPSEQGLLHHTAGPVHFRDVDGRVLTFTPDPAGGYQRPQDLDADLTKNADGSFTLVFNSGEAWAFDSNGRFTGKSLEGQSVTVTYDGAGLPQRVAHSSGRHLILSYDAQGHLTEAESDDGRVVSYGYDGSGLLGSVTGPAGAVTRYASSGGRLAQVTDANGNLVVTNVYGDSLHRVTRQVLAGGRTASFDYDDGSGLTSVTNQSGARMTFQADSAGRLVSATDAAGNTATFKYDGNGYLSEAVSPGGVLLTQTRDARGNLLTSTFGGATLTCVYDSFDRPTSVTNPVGDTATYSYSGASRIPTAITAPGGATSQLTSAGGQITSATDADGGTTSYGYDGVGNLTSIKDPAGNTFQFGHDSAGNPTSFATPAGETSLFSYDGVGRLLSATDATGAVTQLGYSAAGQLTQVTDPTGAATVNAYDEAGNLTSITDPLGRQTTFGYDADGNQTSATSPAGLTTTLAYDSSGRLISVTDAAGGTTGYGYDADGNQVTETDALGRITRRAFDSRGNVTSVTDAAGNTSSFEYDLNDRQIKITNADGNTWLVSYDSVGHSVTGTDPAGDTTTAQWTPGGRLASSTDQLGRKASYSYNAGGQVSQATDPSGETAHYQYDSSGRVTSVTTPAGLVTSFRYDQAGKLIATVDPRGWITSYAYDERGQRTAVITPSGAVTRYQYDAAGQLTELTDPNDGVTGYRYDNAGRLTSVTDPKAATTQYGYDNAGRLTSVTDPLGRVTQRQYDKSGNLTAIIDPGGRAQHFAYDNAGRVISRSADDAATTVSYTYDKAGQRTSMTDATGTTHYAYDSKGRLTTVTEPDGAATTAAYDAAGQRTSLSYPSGLQVSYGYDNNGRLISLQDSRAGQALYALDPDGRLLTEQLGCRLARRYHYDFGLLSRFEAIRDGHPVAFASFAYDPDGRILSQRDRDQVQEYRYDPAGQLIFAASEPAAPPPGPRRERTELRLAYDAAGNRSSLRHGGTEVHYHYDEADQLLHSESRGHRISYRYDQAGRLTEEAEGDRRRSVAYDGFGQPCEVTRTGPGEHERIRPVFNGDGLLASLALTDENGRQDEDHQASVQYRWGSFGLIPQIITQQARPDLDDASHDRPGRLDADFAYGYGRTFASWAQDAAIFHCDALGSMISTEDTRPWVRGHAYGAFGAVADSAAPDGQERRKPELPRFGYRGELGLGDRLYLRARTYDPETGRFTTRDPASSVPTPGQPSNPYAYASSDPLDRTDPRGLLLVPVGGGAGPDTASLARDAIGGIIAGVASATSSAVQDVADMFTSTVSAHTNAPRPVLPPGWPGLLSANLFYEFGTPPTCTGPKQTWSEACLEPLTPFASRGATWSGMGIQLELLLSALGGTLARTGIAGTLLIYWLNASGQPIELPASWLQSLYQVPNVQQAINKTARDRIPPWAQAEFARGQVVPSIDIAVPGSTVLAWSTTIPPNPDPKQSTLTTLRQSALHEISSEAANQLDWFLALATFDYRIWNWSLNGTKITFSFEISKYYDQGKPILGYSTQQFQDLIAEGLARNFWIVGISNNITIPVVG